MRLPEKPELPIALSIAGSDSGGGAGVQADLKTFAATGVHGVSVITCITAQNPKRVASVQSVSARMINEQLQAVFSSLRPQAMKTGMLYSASMVRMVAEFVSAYPRIPLVIDPVIAATSGRRLMTSGALHVLKSSLLPLGRLVTPNIPEAEILLGRRIRQPEDLRNASRELFERYGCLALVKGGHLENVRCAIDVLYDGREEWMFRTSFVPRIRTHGTGCVYSAAITAELARDTPLTEAILRAKEFIAASIVGALHARGNVVLDFQCSKKVPRRRQKL